MKPNNAEAPAPTPSKGHSRPAPTTKGHSRFSSMRKKLSKMNLLDRRASTPDNAPDTSTPADRTPTPSDPPSILVPQSLATIPGGAPALDDSPLIPRNDSAIVDAPIETFTNEAMPAKADSASAPSSTTLADQTPPPPSPMMKKASPMPLPAYPTPSTPWQQHTNGVTTDATPSSAGKTTQVLARLTSENDRLRREINAEKAAKEEALQQYQLLKGRVNRLEEQNGTIQMQFDHNETALVRKERRIDDLRLTLEEESARRKRAEEREAEIGRKLGETVSRAAQDVSEAHEAQKASEVAYETLKREYTGLEKRIQLLRDEVVTAVKRIDAEKAVHRKQLTQLEVLLDQERNQQEKANKDVREMGLLIQSYRATEENVKYLEAEMQKTVHEMRWAMRLQEARQPTQDLARGSVQENRRPPAV
ncbi:hypothetical protein BLS_002853 [Venturia inaequalis]|uniref:SWI5-dependent HO expression protein 3 n=1 Tax=Venturia inaequalis TaxID=5025 RepID=A0A8H3UTF6_VENIN|nr:hypothetical protein BLS_002853 [Venturia inaequalis]KAE9974988.1 hypothetical protein EG328_003526 [Venturia inaequalis]RDI89904.1 hypothetical protein Vi05172_g817 [Venturia inaequalis]